MRDSTSVALSISDGKKVPLQACLSKSLLNETSKIKCHQIETFPISPRFFFQIKSFLPFQYFFYLQFFKNVAEVSSHLRWLTGLMDRVSHKLFNRAAATLSKRMGKSFLRLLRPLALIPAQKNGWAGYVITIKIHEIQFFSLQMYFLRSFVFSL